jgi:hypothetical protein
MVIIRINRVVLKRMVWLICVKSLPGIVSTGDEKNGDLSFC